ncbi:MAG: hypothetical protein K2K31_02685, partial [Clostridia bacterium]|nr:hypothetical protein [Clostridia bacterium]
FAIGYKYKVYYLIGNSKNYLNVFGQKQENGTFGKIIYVNNNSKNEFKACSDLEGYDYVSVRLTYAQLNRIVENGTFNLYIEENGSEIGLNTHTLSDDLIELGQYKSTSVGGTVTKTDDKNVYKLSSNNSIGYDFSAVNVDSKDIGYVSFSGSNTIISSEVGKKESLNAFMISGNKVNTSGEYEINVHGTYSPFEIKDQGKVYYDNILSAFIQYNYNLYNNYENILTLPEGSKIDVYFYLSVKQSTFNCISMVDDQEQQVVSASNRVEVYYYLPNDGGKVTMYEDIFRKDLKVYFGATVNITLMDEYGYRFVGLYYRSGGEYKLVSLPSQIVQVSGNIVYKYQFDFTSISQIDLVAKYVSYTTTTKMLYPTNRVYSISSAEDLIWLSKGVESGNSYEGYTFKQTCNINFAYNQYLNPIGTVKTSFKGVYDGNNYVISNLKFFANDDYTANLSNIGLFAYTDGATIRNVNILGGTRNILGLSNVGGVVGYAKNTTFKFVNNHNLNISLKDSTDQYIFVEIFNFKYYVLGVDDATVENIVMQRYGGVVGFAQDCNFTAVACSANILTNKIHTAGLIGYATGTSIDHSYYDKTRSEIVGAESSSLNMGLTYGSANSNNFISDSCVYTQTETVYYRVETSNRSTSVKPANMTYDESTGNFKVILNGDTLILTEWFLLNGRPELKMLYWGY